MGLTMLKFLFLSTILLSMSFVTFAQNTPVVSDDAIDQKLDNKPDKSEKTVPEAVAFFKHGIGLGIGQTILLDDFADHGDDELAFDLFYQYRASYTFDFLVNLHTNTYKKEDGQKTDLTGVTFNIKGRVFDFDSFAPYLTGGLGMYWPKVTRFQGTTLVESEKQSVLGVNLGAGVDLQLNENFSFGFASLYHQPFNVKQDRQSSINGSYLRFMAMVFIHF